MAWSDIASITISTSIWDRSGFTNCDRLEPNGRRRSLFVHAVHPASLFHVREPLDSGAGDLPRPSGDRGPRLRPGRHHGADPRARAGPAAAAPHHRLRSVAVRAAKGATG